LWLIAVLGYVSGFLLSGIGFSYMLSPKTQTGDMLLGMLLWPVALPGYFIGRGISAYIGFLEGNRSKRARRKVITTQRVE